jgi:glycosyltransferase involved in cell wall biosynthesis
MFANYDLEKIRRSWEAEDRDAPAQHLWGYASLAANGATVDILSPNPHGWLSRVSRRIGLFGDLGLQWRALRAASRYDVIYSAHHLTSSLLAFCRLVGVLRTPVLAIGYQSPKSTGPFWRLITTLFARGYDRLLCMSDAMEQDYRALGIPAERLGQIRWGVDLPLYRGRRQAERDGCFISPGKTHRDFQSLVAGLPDGARLTICGAGRDPDLPEADSIGAEIAVVQKNLPWRDYLDRFSRASVVVLPLNTSALRGNNAIGLTALTEAMALGVPALVTRNDYLGLDIEGEGVGFWVTPDDAADWRDKMTTLMTDQATVERMRERAIALAESMFNLDAFDRTLQQALHEIAGDRS